MSEVTQEHSALLQAKTLSEQVIQSMYELTLEEVEAVVGGNGGSNSSDHPCCW